MKGAPLALRLRERLLRTAHVMTADEERRFLKDGFEPYTKYDYRAPLAGRSPCTAQRFGATESQSSISSPAVVSPVRQASVSPTSIPVSSAS